MADYVNHLARNYIIAFGTEDPLLSKFYAIQWKLIPNLAMDLVVPPLARIVGIFTAGKLFILSYMAIMFVGPQAIHRALLGRYSLAPLIAALFLYNGENRDGVVNYLFGLGVSLWAVAAWILLRGTHPLLRAAVSLGFIVLIFICHLSAVGLYGVGILAYEAWIFAGHRWRMDQRFWIDMAVLVAPFVVVPVLMEHSATVGFAGSIHWSAHSKFYGLRAVVKTERLSIDLCVVLGMVVAAGLAWRRGYLRVHPVGWFLVVLAIPIYLALPYQFLSAGDVDVRFPIGVLFLLLGMLEWELPTARAQGVFLASIFLFALVRVAIVATVWLPFRNVVADFEASLQDVARGSRVMIAHPHEPEPAVFGLFYLPCLAMIERSSLVSLAFSHPGQQVLTVQPPFREFAGGYNDDPPDILDVLTERSLPGSRPYWHDWVHHYDYVYLIWDTDSANPAPDRLAELYRGINFRLYRVVH